MNKSKETEFNKKKRNGYGKDNSNYKGIDVNKMNSHEKEIERINNIISPYAK